MDELNILTNEIEQGFMQRGGWKACRYLLGKLVADKDREIKRLTTLCENLVGEEVLHQNGQYESGTIYLMSRTEQIEDATSRAQTKEFLTKEAARWYWGSLTKPKPNQLVINVDFERLVVEVRDAESLEITTYYLFAFERK